MPLINCPACGHAISTEAEASAGDVARLIKQIKAERIAAVFVESISDPRLLEQVGRRPGAAICCLTERPASRTVFQGRLGCIDNRLNEPLIRTVRPRRAVPPGSTPCVSPS